MRAAGPKFDWTRPAPPDGEERRLLLLALVAFVLLALGIVAIPFVGESSSDCAELGRRSLRWDEAESPAEVGALVAEDAARLRLAGGPLARAAPVYDAAALAATNAPNTASALAATRAAERALDSACGPPPG